MNATTTPPQFDDEVLLLRLVNEAVNSATIERHVAATPGAVREPEPRESSTWLLAAHPACPGDVRIALGAGAS